jgi:hypothetical protein
MARHTGDERRAGVVRRRAARRTLRDVAEALQLSPATVSLVLNQAPAAAAIPAETQEFSQT